MFPLELPNASGIRPLHFTVLTVAMVILAVFYLIYIGARWSGYWNGEALWLDAPHKQSVVIGDATFVVPLALLPGPSNGYSILPGPHRTDTLSLKVTWPEMKPVRATSARNPANALAEANIILVNITRVTSDETMRDRLEPVYKRLARGPEVDGPAGLKVLTLSSPVALNRDEIVFEAASNDSGFIARCQRSRDSGSHCSRELRLDDGLHVTYNFSRKLLTNWGRLDRKIIQLVKSLRS